MKNEEWRKWRIETNAYTITKKYQGDDKGNFKRHQPHVDLFVGDM